MSLDRYIADERGMGSVARIKRKTLYKPGPAMPYGTKRAPKLPDEQGAEVLIYGLDANYRVTRTSYWPTTDRNWLEVRELPPVPRWP